MPVINGNRYCTGRKGLALPKIIIYKLPESYHIKTVFFEIFHLGFKSDRGDGHAIGHSWSEAMIKENGHPHILGRFFYFPYFSRDRCQPGKEKNKRRENYCNGFQLFVPPLFDFLPI